MYDRQFFSTQLGKVSLLCMAAMVAMNVAVVMAPIDAGVLPVATTSVHSGLPQVA